MTLATRWGRELGLLEARFAPLLAAMMRQLDAAFGPLRPKPGAQTDDPDGWDGVERRGPVHRLLPSELALLHAAPLEATRRIVEGEASYHALAYHRPQGAQGCAVLFDAGPDQLGAPRVGHLALWLWLAGRAREAGATFRWGVLQQADRAWRTAVDGDAGLALLTARSWATPEPGWDTADVGELWVVSPTFTLPGARQVLLAEEGDHLELRAGRRLRLPLPDRTHLADLLQGAFEADTSAERWWSVTLAWADAALVVQRNGSLEAHSRGPRRLTTRRPVDGRLLAAAWRGPAITALLAEGDQLRLLRTDPIPPTSRAPWAADELLALRRTGSLEPWDMAWLSTPGGYTLLLRSPDRALYARHEDGPIVTIADDIDAMFAANDQVVTLSLQPRVTRRTTWAPRPGHRTFPLAAINQQDLPPHPARSGLPGWDGVHTTPLWLARGDDSRLYAPLLDGRTARLAVPAGAVPLGVCTSLAANGATPAAPRWIIQRKRQAIHVTHKGRERVLLEDVRASAASRGCGLVALATGDQTVYIVDIGEGRLIDTLEREPTSKHQREATTQKVHSSLENRRDGHEVSPKESWTKLHDGQSRPVRR
jgi:hypothetical protein